LSISPAVIAARLSNASKSGVSLVLGGTMFLELLYLGLVWKIHDIAHLGMSLLFIGAVYLLLTERPSQPPSDAPDWSARLLGGLVMAGVAVSCIYLFGAGLKSTEQHPLRMLPVLALLGTALWSAGYRGVWDYRRELMVLFFLGGPHLLVWWLHVPDLLALFDAKVAGFFLWYSGVEVVVKDVNMYLEGGAIKITAECAGSDIITYLLGIALVSTMLFPLPRPRYALVLGTAVVIAFFTNVVRVALLAILNTDADKASFHYWHTSQGAQAFGVTAMILFAAFYYYLERVERSEPRAEGI